MSIRYLNFGFVSARPGADLRIALLPFLKAKTKYMVPTMWPVWARDFDIRISCLRKYAGGIFLILPLLAIVFLSACILLPMPERKLGEEETLLKELLTLADAKDYKEVIEKSPGFMEAFPESKYYDVVLLNLGQAYEGLLATKYYKVMEDGEPEGEAKKVFMEKYGHYQCWVETSCGLSYDLGTYKEMMEKFPDSRWADEAEYHLIPWICEYGGLPEGPLKEIGYVEDVLQKYPTSSLKGEFYYKIAYRFQILYEIYAFSPQRGLRNEAKASDYKKQALYFYKMALKHPVHSQFSKKAWEDLDALEQGRRIYILE